MCINQFQKLILQTAEEDSGTETDDETGDPDEGKTMEYYCMSDRGVLDFANEFWNSPHFRKIQRNCNIEKFLKEFKTSLKSA